jgi:hypothetical protein
MERAKKLKLTDYEISVTLGAGNLIIYILHKLWLIS